VRVTNSDALVLSDGVAVASLVEPVDAAVYSSTSARRGSMKSSIGRDGGTDRWGGARRTWAADGDVVLMRRVA